MLDDLVDRIYEAAFVPQLWPTVLDEICARSRSASGALQILKPGGAPLWASTDRIRETLGSFIDNGDWKTCGRPLALAVRDYPGFLNTLDCLNEEQKRVDKVVPLLSRLGLGWQVATLIPMPTAEMVGLTFERAEDFGPHRDEEIDWLDSLRPHLARAALMSARLSMQRAQTVVATLEGIGLPAAVVAPSGRVLAANPLLAESPAVLPTAMGGMRLTHAPANIIFHDVLAVTLETGGSRSIPLPATEGRKPAVIHVMPLRGAARDILSGAVMVVLTTIDATAGILSPSVLRTLFDLTPKEAQVAAGLAAGRPLAKVSGDLGIGLATARAHLRRIFIKTGTGQQSELVALIKGGAFGAGTGQEPSADASPDRHPVS